MLSHQSGQIHRTWVETGRQGVTSSPPYSTNLVKSLGTELSWMGSTGSMARTGVRSTGEAEPCPMHRPGE